MGGDLCRTVGGKGDEARIRSTDARRFPTDLGSVLIDGRQHWFVAHLVARRSWWFGRVVAVMNAQWIETWDIAPKSHPNDGLLDVFDGDPGFDDRLKMRRRLLTGTHVPHPDIATSRVGALQVSFDRPTPDLARRRTGGIGPQPVDPLRTRCPDLRGLRVGPRPHRAVPSGAMQAWILDESPGGYRYGEIADPAVGPDDVRVRPVASALNHMDLWVTKGKPRPHLPHIPGCDVAGVIEAVGSHVSGVAVGDEVVVNPAVSPIEMVAGAWR